MGVQSWQKWNEKTAKHPELATRTRWGRNYLRHECMSYEDLLCDVGRGLMTAVREAYTTIRDRCERRIDERYPDLA